MEAEATVQVLPTYCEVNLYLTSLSTQWYQEQEIHSGSRRLEFL